MHSKQWHYSLHRDFQNCYSTRRSPTGFFKLRFQLQFQLQCYTCTLHYNPETFQTFQSFMTFQPFQAILQYSSISRESTPFQHSPIRMHILHILQILQFDWFPQKTPPSTSWAITDITNIHSKKGRCCDIGQVDRFFIIELFPLSSLSSDNTNCKNDIPLFHQLFDELSVYRDYH